MSFAMLKRLTSGSSQQPPGTYSPDILPLLQSWLAARAPISFLYKKKRGKQNQIIFHCNSHLGGSKNRKHDEMCMGMMGMLKILKRCLTFHLRASLSKFTAIKVIRAKDANANSSMHQAWT
jgi:hypothetical protein